MKLFAIVTLIAVGATACGKESPLARTEPSKTAAFAVDANEEFHFELGRGSGMEGLDTISFGRDGDVTLFRQHPQGKWQTAALKVTPAAITRILEVVKTQAIMKMPSAFHADVYDGTQWVLWIKQDQRSKAIYFDNYFPAGVKRLAAQLDRELADAGLAGAEWNDVPTKNFRQREKPLWNSMK